MIQEIEEMKKIILLAVFAICSLFTKGQIQTFDSLSFTTEKEAYVQLRGKTKGIYWGKIDSIYVKVYIGNNAVYGNYHLRGNFQINLPIDRKITLEILRKGFYPKRITVNTAGARPIPTSKTSSEPINILSATGSSNLPSFVVCP